MARVIPRDSIIYRVQYSATYYEFVECKSEIDLFDYLASQRNQIVTGVNEMCLNGTRPRIAVNTNPLYKKIVRAKEMPPIIEVAEEYWCNNNGCHYYLTPLNASDKEMIGGFSIHSLKLSQARNAGKDWIKSFAGQYQIKVIEK